MWKYIITIIICLIAVLSVNAETITVGSKSGDNKATLYIPVKIDNPEYVVGTVMSIEFSKKIKMTISSKFFDIVEKNMPYSRNNKIYNIAAAKAYPDTNTNTLFTLKTELIDKRSSAESDIIIKPILLNNKDFGWNNEYHDILTGYKNNKFVTLISYDNYQQKIINGSVSFINPCTKEDEPRITRFVANKYTIYEGDSVKLSWNAENVDKVGMTDGGVFGIGSFQPNSSKSFSPSRNTDYHLNASNECGKDKKIVSITVKEQEPVDPPDPPDPPDPGCESPPEIENFRSEKNEIEYGSQTKLSWSIKNSDVVTITDMGEVDNTGTVNVSPQKTKTYTIKSENECGVSEKSITINVYCSVPNIEFSTNKISDNKFLLKWNVTNADFVEIDKIGTVGNTGTKEIITTETETYTITARNICGEDENITSKAVEMMVCDEPEIEYFRSDRMIVQGRDEITLSWKINNTDKVDLKGYGSVNNIGEKTININNTTEFHLRTSNECGFDEAKITVEVKELNLPGGSCFINNILGE